MRISDWSSDVCSSDLDVHGEVHSGFIHRIANEQNFRTAFQAGFVPFADTIDADGVCTQMATSAAVRIHVGDDVKSCLFTHQPGYSIIPISVTLYCAHSEVSRLGKGCVSKCRTTWTPHI